MRLVFLLVSVTSAMAAGTGQGFSGSFSQGNGQGYGYGGSFGSGSGSNSGSGSGSGSNSGGIPQGFAPFDFNNLLEQYFQVFTKFNQDLASTRLSAYSYSITNADSNSKATAKSSITFKRKGLQNQQNAFAAGGYGFPGGYPAFASSFGNQGGNAGGNPSYSGGGYGGGFSNFGGSSSGSSGGPPYSSGGFGGGFSNSGGQGASASASIGPGGYHQTAAVYPENPNNPNVNTRFGGGGGSPGGSSYGVFTSSQSVSSNVNGKPTSQHTAQTTINDNGKVTSYTVHNP